MSVPVVVDCQWLKENLNSVKVLDSTYALKAKPDFREFYTKYYGKFEDMILEQKCAEFETGHIDTAVYFNHDIACYPGEFERFALYPPELFEKYVQLLGVDNDDHIVIYGRGPAAGMLFASRALWLFKVYGHEKVSVLEGGFDAWNSHGFPVSTGITAPTRGDFVAKPLNKDIYITFDELWDKNAQGQSMFDDLSKINYLDCRPAEQYNGETPLGVPAPGATGFHLTGAKHVPLAAVMNPTGIKSNNEIEKALETAEFVAGHDTVCACTGGVQASLLYVTLTHSGKRAKVFNGSMSEVAGRAPQLINAK